MIRSKLTFTLRKLRERLWIKPLGYAVMAVAATFVAEMADVLPFAQLAPDISFETLEKLLTVISASMLGVATFAVASMVSAYASASSSATPRAFVLVVSDGVSQTALSSFIGAFIFSIVGIIAVKVEYFDATGRFAMFLITLAVFAWVILTFVRWVDNIARLGRMGNTIEKVEAATRDAFAQWKPWAPLSARPASDGAPSGTDLHAETIGFIQHVDIAALQAWAEKHDSVVHLSALPGAFVTARRPLLTAETPPGGSRPDMDGLHDAFVLAQRRSYTSDPRFGLIVMSEIGCRALSPAINDPGTAIDIAVRMAHLLRDWSVSPPEEDRAAPEFDRVRVPALAPEDLLDDAFAAIIKDGVGSVELDIWVQKSLGLLVQEAAPELARTAASRARQALDRAESDLSFPPDIDRVRRAHRSAVEGAGARAS
ncbi:Uncharacterized membrane protein [Roseivivax lentus]|uniref:Uncharacterized membrane protein n=1 Tax=Roseivivax lentus TaxID=633194 RepID=A0A1N7PG05_9RHOB|nr:DUF2254 domain-containing protein [Roseivivax lentus]SIT09522.1 Uncharacterized membrane protein [Roseivivax lentus]